MQTATQTTIQTPEATNLALVTLEKVSADYKLQAGQQFLTQGRINKKHPTRPYYHVIRTSNDLSATAPSEFASMNATTRTALLKLWNIAALEMLKDKAAPMTAGSTITASIDTVGILAYIADMGNRERTAISSEELTDYCDSYAMQALGMVHNWSAAQLGKVKAVLTQYAAVAHRKQPKDATILLSRLEALPSLLTGDDTSEDDSIMTIHNWLVTKLTRDSNTEAVNLADSI